MTGDKHYTLGIHVIHDIHVVYILASHWTEWVHETCSNPDDQLCTERHGPSETSSCPPKSKQLKQCHWKMPTEISPELLVNNYNIINYCSFMKCDYISIQMPSKDWVHLADIFKPPPLSMPYMIVHGSTMSNWLHSLRRVRLLLREWLDLETNWAVFKIPLYLLAENSKLT